MDSFKSIDLREAEDSRDAAARSSRRMRRFWIFFGIAGALVVFGLVRLWYATPHVSATEISDAAYVKEARQVCAHYMPILKSQQTKKGEQLNVNELGTRVDKSANTMDEMVSKLKQLENKSSSEAAINDWYRNWDGYIQTGHLYADAVRTEKQSEWVKVSKDGDRYSNNIEAFAFVNKITECELRTELGPVR